MKTLTPPERFLKAFVRQCAAKLNLANPPSQLRREMASREDLD